MQEGIKICIYLVKKKDMSDGEFVRYYSETHARLALPALVRHACISYTQVKLLLLFMPDVVMTADRLSRFWMVRVPVYSSTVVRVQRRRQ